MKELVEYMVRPLVDHPDDVQVSVLEGSASILLELRLHPEDERQVRGPQNQLLRAMQQVLAVAGGPRKPVLDLVGQLGEEGADEE